MAWFDKEQSKQQSDEQPDQQTNRQSDEQSDQQSNRQSDQQSNQQSNRQSDQQSDKRSDKKSGRQDAGDNQDSSAGDHSRPTKLEPSLAANMKRIKDGLELCSDIVYREFTFWDGRKAELVYLDGLCDTEQIEENVVKPLMKEPETGSWEDGPASMERIKDKLVYAMETSVAEMLDDVVRTIMTGVTALLIDGEAAALMVSLIKMEQRAVAEPTSEKVVRGPRDGFTESLRTNMSLIRRRIITHRLKSESFSIGELSQTQVVLMYIQGIVKNELLEEVKKRITRIKVDGIIYSQDIEEFIEESAVSPFPQVENTERPDVASASLLEGKIVIIVNNSPIVLIVPMSYWSGLQAADDYTERPMYASLIRWLRYIFIHISLLLPSLYVALTTFHPEVIPTPLLISIASAREGVPFPAVIEAFLMEFIFEGLREAGIRLPQQVGPAVSIAGALVIGQAVVAAGIVSSSMVIIVSLTGIASFAFPMYNIGTSFRMLRFLLLFISGFIGFYGIMLFMILMTVHLVTLKPFGIPYMAPATPLEPTNLRDVLIRAPKWKMSKRMKTLVGDDQKRMPKQ